MRITGAIVGVTLVVTAWLLGRPIVAEQIHAEATVAHATTSSIFKVQVSNGAVESINGLRGAHPAWSPDGSEIAFTRSGDGSSNVYVSKADGTDVRQLTREGNNVHPTWSPDGGRIAFASSRSGNFDIDVMDVVGGGVVRLTRNPAPDIQPAWSPDGEKIAFASRRSGGWSVYTIDLSTLSTVRVTTASSRDVQPTWAPRGNAIAFVSDRIGGNLNVFKRSFRTGRVVQLTFSSAADTQPAWSPRGSNIAFSSSRTGVKNIFETPARGGVVRQLTALTEGPNEAPSWSPNADWLLFSGASPSPSPPGPSTSGLLALDQGDLAAATQPGRYGYVILNAWNYQQIPALKAANPDIKVLVYKDMSSTRSYACVGGQDDALLPTGVGYCLADANHPDWFLLDQNGGRIEWRGYPGHWWMDVGNLAYQNAWVGNVLPELRANGWDGVYIDNAIIDPVYYLQPGETIARYPTQALYQAATESLLSRVGPELTEGGFEAVPNLGGSDGDAALFARWAGDTSGAMREHWAAYGTDGAPLLGGAWDRMMSQMQAVQAAGKTFLAITRGSRTNVPLQRYARASFLLGWKGAGAMFYRTPQGTDPWSGDWTLDIGTPTGGRYQVGAAWRRDFTGGCVVVNPSSGRITVALGSDYLDQDGETISSLTLDSGTAAILRPAP